MTKAWYKSKTLWFNTLSALLVSLESYVGLLGAYFEADAMRVIVGVIVVGNLLLRVVTTTALSATDK